jgi:hypothetical protein
MRLIGVAVGVFLASSLQSAVRADRQAPPVRTFSSADGLTHIRVTPGDPPTESATGKVFRESNGSEETVWEGKLVNTPDRAFVSPTGSVATVEHYSHQWDQHAVVVYDHQGKVIADFPLNRFLDHQEIFDFKRTIRESIVLWNESWTGKSKFTMKDDGNEFIVEPPSGRLRRISTLTGEMTFGDGAQLEPPTVSLIGTSPDNGLSLVFEAMNPNDVPMYYVGYTRDSFNPPIPAGRLYPIYTMDVERNGAWENVNVGHCKTGQGEVAIPARASQKFLIPLLGELKEPVRYGLRWHRTGEQWTSETAWGESITQSDVDRLVKARDAASR